MSYELEFTILQLVKKTRKSHRCLGCKTQIKKGNEAFMILKETHYGVEIFRDFSYFHNVECYNDYEINEGSL